MSDADDRFAEALAGELDPPLGPRIDVVEVCLERPADDRVRIAVLVETSAGVQRLVEEGDSLTSVAAAMLERAPIHRLADGFREIVDPETMKSH